MKYQVRVKTIHAVQRQKSNQSEVAKLLEDHYRKAFHLQLINHWLLIELESHSEYVKEGDWVVVDQDGEVAMLTDTFFRQKYEKVE